MHVDSSPRAQAEREEREAAARQASEAEQRRAAAADRLRRAEEAARREEQIRAIPDALVDDDPQIKALRADYEVKTRQRPVLTSVGVGSVLNAIEALQASLKAASIEILIAAVEDTTNGDPMLRTAMSLQRQADDDATRLGILTRVRERLGTSGFAMLAREREQQSKDALRDALMERKRQHHAQSLQAA